MFANLKPARFTAPQNHFAASLGLVDAITAINKELSAGGESRFVCQRNFIRIGRRPAGCAADRNAIRAARIDFDGGEIEIDVGSQIMGRIADFVNQLLDNGLLD